MTAPSDRLTFRERLGYGCGDFASVLYWQTISLYLLYFYTDVFGITAAAAGTMILVSRLWDGVNDPMMGIIADRTNSRWGKFRPYLIWFSIPMAFIGVVTFSTPNLGPSAKLVYAYVTYILFMMTYTAINIPYSSLLGVITPDPIERTSVASYKYVCAYFAGFVVSATALPLIQFLGRGNEATGWQTTMGLYGIVATVFFYITFLSTKERVSPPKTQKTSIRSDLKDLFSNKPWVILLFTTLFQILFIVTRSSVTAHYFKYFVGEQTFSLFGHTTTLGFVGLTSIYNSIGQIACIVGVICTKWIAGALGKKRAFLLLSMVAIACTYAFYFLHESDVLYMLVFQAIGSFAGGPLSPLIWAMYADTADYSEWKTGRRATGLVFSASTMSQKMGWAVGTFFAGMLLSAVGFEANMVPTAEVKEGLRSLMSVIPCAAGAVFVVLVTFYRLDEKTMKGIEADLTRRRELQDGLENGISA